MNRFTLPRDLYHGENALEALKTFTGKRAVICVGGGSMKRFGFLDRAIAYLQEAGMKVKVIDGIEPVCITHSPRNVVDVDKYGNEAKEKTIFNTVKLMETL